MPLRTSILPRQTEKATLGRSGRDGRPGPSLEGRPGPSLEGRKRPVTSEGNEGEQSRHLGSLGKNAKCSSPKGESNPSLQGKVPHSRFNCGTHWRGPGDCCSVCSPGRGTDATAVGGSVSAAFSPDGKTLVSGYSILIRSVLLSR